MIIPDLFDLAVNDLHHLCTDSFSLFAPGPGSLEERFRYPASAMAGAQTQFAVRIREHRKFSFV
jgi:hypothetical protein